MAHSVYLALAVGTLAAHLLFIAWVVFGALITHRRPGLRWLHIASLVYGILSELLPWNCPLTAVEIWLETRADLVPYRGPFLLHYLRALLYPNISPAVLTASGVAACVANLAFYAWRLSPRRRVS